MRTKLSAGSLLLALSLVPPGWAGDLTVDNLTVVQEGVVYGRLTLPGAPTDGLKLFYNFDADEGGVATDRSGNGNTGVVSGATWTTNGASGAAYSFDGINDYIQASDSASLDIRGALSISVWAKDVSTGAPVRALVMKHNDSADRAYALYMDNVGATLQLSSSGAENLYQIRTLQCPATGVWTHIVTTWDGTPNAGGKIYFNGAEQSLQTTRTNFLGTNIFNSSQPLRVGAKSNGNWWFRGMLDDARVYNRALSAAEVKALYNNTAPGIWETNVVLRVDGLTELRRLVKQGDIEMGPYTNGP